ncbi:MAG: MobF family relaxase [Verrucomicrobiales bacterium]
MITATSISGGETYLKKHLRANDYYAQGESVEGEWFGKGAAKLGLSGAVDAEHFEALRDNRHPFTGERLTARDRRSYTAANGVSGRAEERKPVALHDITLNAPKTASIAAIVGGDERIREAWAQSVKVALTELERFAAVRLRTGDFANSEKLRITGNVVGAIFHHDASRSLDPQLHAHAVLANASHDSERDQWLALQRRAMMEASRYVRRALHQDFARRLRQLGYTLEREGESFRIEGISREVEQAFSERTRQRLAFEKRYLDLFGHAPTKRRVEQFIKDNQGAAEVRFRAEFQAAFGKAPTADEVSAFVVDWREPKLREIATPAVRQRQRDRLTDDDLKTIEALVAKARGNATANAPAAGNHRQAAQLGLEHCLERLSVARLGDVLEAALKFGGDGFGNLDPTKLYRQVREASGAISDGYQITTEQALEEEARLLRFARHSQNAFAPLGDTEGIAAMATLGRDQRAAVEGLAGSRDGIAVLIGDAGTGKTHALSLLHEAHLRLGGNAFIALAPTTRATEELRRNGFASAATVASFLNDERAQQEAEARTLLVDEAGLVSSRQMAELVRIAQERKARILLVGDTKQHEAVERGNALRNLIEADLVIPHRLHGVRRQKRKVHRKLARLLARGDAEGAVAHADQLGLIEEIPHAPDLFKAAAKHYADAVEAGREMLVVIPTWAEIDWFNDEARQQLRERGLIRGESIEIEGSASLSWTEVEKIHWQDYQPGYVLNFHRGAAGVAPGESVRVKSVLPKGLIAERQDGSEVRLTKKQRHAFDVAEAAPLEIAAGDELLFRANCPEIGVHNGERVKVTGVADGRVHLANGDVLPENFTQVCHGHAVTSHKSQGASVQDSLLVLGPISLGSGVVDLRQFYVSNTRFREDHRMFVANRSLLLGKVGRRNERMLAREFVAELGKELDALLAETNAAATKNGSNQRQAEERAKRIRAILREVEHHSAKARSAAARQAIVDQLGIRRLPERFRQFWQSLTKRRHRREYSPPSERLHDFAKRFRRRLRVFRWCRRSARNAAFRKASYFNKPAALETLTNRNRPNATTTPDSANGNGTRPFHTPTRSKKARRRSPSPPPNARSPCPITISKRCS